jgi:Uma2 family endonuclease
MALEARLLTADAFFRMPLDEGWRYELIRGELRRLPVAGHVHGDVAMQAGASLAVFVRQRRLGKTYAAETGFVIARSPDTVRCPDAAFVSTERLAGLKLSDHGFFPGPPDLALEVQSPSDSKAEIEEKTAAWLAGGTRAVLLIDPRRRTAKVHRPQSEPISFGATDTVTLPDLLPGWSLSLADIFGP